MFMSGGSETTIKSLRTKVAESALGLGAALSGCNVRRMSIHDATGHLAWTSGAALSGDEHEFLLDALDCFALEPARPVLEREGEGGFGLVAFAARDPRGALHGALLLDVELATVSGRPGERLMPARGERLMRQLALRLGSATPRVATPPGAGFSGQPLTLYVQQLLKLAATGRTRRYEVLLRTRDTPSGEPALPQELIAAAEQPDSGGALDRAVLAELCRWLIQNRPQLDVEPAAFSINLSTGALLDPSFPEFVATTLEEARLNPRLIGFEIRERQCREHPDAVQAFVEHCERIGCHIVLDDFTFHPDVLGLLRMRAVRMLKICPSLTLDGLGDRISQAQVAAISQGSRVLGIHSAAKRIESPQARQWLTAVGIEFAQGYLFESPLPLAELSASRLAGPQVRL
jgi:EAL domain-containing protein (putative c-di-GMP-specific phosphodiesterase class I)